MHLSTQYLKVFFQNQIFTESNKNNFIRVIQKKYYVFIFHIMKNSVKILYFM
ncbi:hypothetical protein BDC45DRAFT_338907 [Circinella umbellata]|nr:hypothetical protein BDC45DRAFT_338907 [Circinella umbellata]